MNAPFKIEEISAEATVGITDLTRNPAAVIAEARIREMAILNRNEPVAYLISPELWTCLHDVLADLHVEEKALCELENDNGERVEIDLERYL